MVNQSAMNLLFFLGVLIPALITVALFGVFCFCWYKMRIRNQIRYKKHDPHKIERLKDGEIYEAPPPPPPPFISKDSAFFSETQNHNNNNVSKNKPTDNYEESPEPTEGFHNPAMYRSNQNGGFSDLNQIHCNVDNSAVQKPNDTCRPNSQASDDSDDSGFRSSRSGQYIHSASSSNSNGQEICQLGVPSCQVHDSVPLFKPIKIHPNEMGRQPLVSYVHRNSSKHKSFNKNRKPIPSSQHYNSGHESRNNKINTISQLQQQQPIAMNQTSHMTHSMAQPCYTIQPFSKANNDVHGGRLHSIDSHVSPLSSVGHFGLMTSSVTDHCGHVHPNGYYSDGHFSQQNSIGYGSQNGPLLSVGYNIGSGQTKSEQLCHLPVSNHVLLNGKLPVSTHIPGYNISHSSHLRPIHPELSMHKFSEPLQTVSESPMPLTITQAMVHRPYIEELTDPKLYSVV